MTSHEESASCSLDMPSSGMQFLGAAFTALWLLPGLLAVLTVLVKTTRRTRQLSSLSRGVRGALSSLAPSTLLLSVRDDPSVDINPFRTPEPLLLKTGVYAGSVVRRRGGRDRKRNGTAALSPLSVVSPWKKP